MSPNYLLRLSPIYWDIAKKNESFTTDITFNPEGIFPAPWPWIPVWPDRPAENLDEPGPNPEERFVARAESPVENTQENPPITPSAETTAVQGSIRSDAPFIRARNLRYKLIKKAARRNKKSMT